MRGMAGTAGGLLRYASGPHGRDQGCGSRFRELYFGLRVTAHHSHEMCGDGSPTPGPLGHGRAPCGSAGPLLRQGGCEYGGTQGSKHRGQERRSFDPAPGDAQSLPVLPGRVSRPGRQSTD